MSENAERSEAKLWIADYIRFYEDGNALPEETIVRARVSLPSDRSFVSWEAALAHIGGAPLPAGTELLWQQALLDVMLTVPIASDGSRFEVDPALAHLGLETISVVHFLPPGGTERVLREVTGVEVTHLEQVADVDVFSGDPTLDERVLAR